MSDGFLARWSRLKHEARQEAARDDVPAEPPDPADVAMTPQEIAALPRVDALTADSDVTVFLRRGVPAALRNAALRKMWLLDPAIRDFAGHARDYDYDWNTPGGAPGHGVLRADDDVVAMVRRVFGESPEAEATPPRKVEAADREAPPNQETPGDDHA